VTFSCLFCVLVLSLVRMCMSLVRAHILGDRSSQAQLGFFFVGQIYSCSAKKALGDADTVFMERA